MAYEKQTFQNGQVLSADQLNHIEDGLKVVSDEVDAASGALSAHNTDSTSHNDIRILISELGNRLNAIADSEDLDLDQLSELVAYIKDNRELIDQITTSKVSVTDIVDDLITNVADRPLSAAQGVVLKNLIDALENNQSTGLYEGAVQTEHIANGAVTLDKVAFTTDAVSKNLIDTTKLTKGRLTDTGTIGGKSDQSVTDFIEIDPLSSYVYSCIGTTGVSYVSYRFEYYDEQKQHISGAGSNGVDTHTKNRKIVDGIIHDYDVLTPPPEARFIRISASTVGFPIAQFEKGVESTTYEAYMTVKRFAGVDVLDSSDIENTLDSKNEKKALSAKQGAILNEAILKNAPKKLTVTLADDSLTISGRIGKSQTVKMEAALRGGSNGQFNLNTTRLYRNGTTQMSGLHGNDEFPPLRTNYGIIGGNHTYSFIGVVDSTGTLANYIGQNCNNGTSDFLLVDYKADSSVGVFVKSYYTDSQDGVSRISTATIAEGDILTFADSVTVTAGAVSSVSYPSVNCHKYSFIVDGKETTMQRDYSCDTFAVREAYNLVSYKGIWEYYSDSTNHGKAYGTIIDEIAGCLTVELTYTISTNCVMTINTAYRAIEPMLLTDCGTIQNARSTSNSTDTVYMYVNNAGEVGGYNFSQVVNMSEWGGTDIVLTPENSNGVCNRNVLLVKRSDGSLSYGFTSGFIPDMSKAKDSERALLGRLWRVADSMKSYPVAVYNKTMMVGESMTFLAYRAILPEETPVTNFNIVDVGETAYLFIDAHESGTYTVDVDAKYCNRVIEVLEQSKISISDDVVGNSITFTVSDSVAGDYAHATLKLKSGGLTEAEKQEIVDRVLDALNSSQEPPENPNE